MCHIDQRATSQWISHHTGDCLPFLLFLLRFFSSENNDLFGSPSTVTDYLWDPIWVSVMSCSLSASCRRIGLGTARRSRRQSMYPFLKGSGTRDYNWLKVEWLNKPDLTLPPDISLHFFNCLFNILFKFWILMQGTYAFSFWTSFEFS